MAIERLTYSIPEAAKALGISKSTAYRMANDGSLPLARVGTRLLVPRAALEQFLIDSMIGPLPIRREGTDE